MTLTSDLRLIFSLSMRTRERQHEGSIAQQVFELAAEEILYDSLNYRKVTEELKIWFWDITDKLKSAFFRTD